MYVEHVLPLADKIGERLINSITVARAWKHGNATVGDARKAALVAIAVARECSNPTAIAVARAVGRSSHRSHGRPFIGSSMVCFEGSKKYRQID